MKNRAPYYLCLYHYLHLAEQDEPQVIFVDNSEMLEQITQGFPTEVRHLTTFWQKSIFSENENRQDQFLPAVLFHVKKNPKKKDTETPDKFIHAIDLMIICRVSSSVIPERMPEHEGMVNHLNEMIQFPFKPGLRF